MTLSYADRQLAGLNELLRIAREGRPHADTLTMPRLDPADQMARLLSDMRDEAARRGGKRRRSRSRETGSGRQGKQHQLTTGAYQ